jgi:hypothetical protein
MRRDVELSRRGHAGDLVPLDGHGAEIVGLDLQLAAAERLDLAGEVVVVDEHDHVGACGRRGSREREEQQGQCHRSVRGDQSTGWAWPRLSR